MPANKRPSAAGKAGEPAPPSGASSSGAEGKAARKAAEKAAIKARSTKPWPTWAYVVAGFVLLLSLGRLLAGGSGETMVKKAKDIKKAKAAKKASSSDDTMRFLEVALRLQEMTELSSNLESSGQLDSDAATQLSKELDTLEAEIGDEGTTARDLKSMVQVVRGTLIQRGNKMTDEEVEATGTAYTYANPRYWDDYYNKTSSDEKYDWYGSWDTTITETTFNPKGAGQRKAKVVGDFLRPYLASDHKILMFGCGNSDMSEKMYGDGYEDIMNIDISEQLLDHLRTRLAAKTPKMRWQYENASALTFEDAAFDVIIDKGTLDAIEANKPLLRAAAQEAHRTLRPGGYFLSITFNSAPVRIEGQLMEAAAWTSCETHEFDRPVKQRDSERNVYYIHACAKRS